MKYAIKGGLFFGIIQLIFFILSNVSLLFFHSPLDLLAILIYCICLLPTAFMVRFIGDEIKIPTHNGIISITEIFGLKSPNYFETPYASWIFSTLILILLGSLIGYIYGKIRERNSFNN